MGGYIELPAAFEGPRASLGERAGCAGDQPLRRLQGLAARLGAIVGFAAAPVIKRPEAVFWSSIRAPRIARTNARATDYVPATRCRGIGNRGIRGHSRQR